MSFKLLESSVAVNKLTLINTYIEITINWSDKSSSQLYIVQYPLTKNKSDEYLTIKSLIKCFAINKPNVYTIVDMLDDKSVIDDINNKIAKADYSVICELVDNVSKIVYHQFDSDKIYEKVLIEQTIGPIDLGIAVLDKNILPVMIYDIINKKQQSNTLIINKPLSAEMYLTLLRENIGSYNTAKILDKLKTYIKILTVNSGGSGNGNGNGNQQYAYIDNKQKNIVKTYEKFIGIDDKIKQYNSEIIMESKYNISTLSLINKTQSQNVSKIDGSDSLMNFQTYIDIGGDKYKNVIIKLVCEETVKYDAKYIETQTRELSNDFITWSKNKLYFIRCEIGGDMIVPNVVSEIITEYNIRDRYGYIIEQLASFYSKPFATSLKGLTNGVITLDKGLYGDRIFPNLKDWLVTAKSDGIHSLLYAFDNSVILINTTVTDYVSASKLPLIICEGELVDDLFVIFDVVYHGTSLLAQSFSERLTHIPAIIDELSKMKMDGLTVSTKKFMLIGDKPAEVFEEVFETTEYPYEIDGMIFSPADTPYAKTVQYKWKPHHSIDFLLKAISAPTDTSKLTTYWLFNGVSNANFHKLGLKRAPKNLSLFPNLVGNKYFPVLFTPPDLPSAYIYQGEPGLDGQVVEMNRVPIIDSVPLDIPKQDDKITVIPKSKIVKIGNVEYITGGGISPVIRKHLKFNMVSRAGNAKFEPHDGMVWNAMRIRHDRKLNVELGTYFGNDYVTAEMTWMASHNPLTFAQLSNFEGGYFREQKQEQYVKMINYNSSIKSAIIESVIPRGAQWVWDFGAGKGQDMFRYAAIGVKNLTAIDIDLDALDILNSRRLTNSHKKDTAVLPNITIIHGDVTNYDLMIDRLSLIKTSNNLIDAKPTAYVFNFTVHYYIDKFDEVMRFIKDAFSANGIYIFTALNGQAVFNLLRDNNIKFGESYVIKDELGAVKFRIERRYTEDEFLPFGQRVGILLPFSKGELYEEMLVNFDYLTSLMSKYGVARTHMSGFLWNEFKHEYGIKDNNTNKLSSIDEMWVQLHTGAVYNKKSVMKK